MAINDDDIYLNAGDSYDTAYYPDQVDEVREQAETKQREMAVSYPVMGAIADWFEACIAACDNLDNVVFDMTVIGGVPVDRKVSIEAQVLAMKLLKEKMVEKYGEFEEFRNERD